MKQKILIDKSEDFQTK